MANGFHLEGEKSAWSPPVLSDAAGIAMRTGTQAVIGGD